MKKGSMFKQLEEKKQKGVASNKPIRIIIRQQ